MTSYVGKALMEHLWGSDTDHPSVTKYSRRSAYYSNQCHRAIDMTSYVGKALMEHLWGSDTDHPSVTKYSRRSAYYSNQCHRAIDSASYPVLKRHQGNIAEHQGNTSGAQILTTQVSPSMAVVLRTIQNQCRRAIG